MNGALTFLRKSGQTRSTIHTPDAEAEKKSQGIRTAYRVLVCVQLITQLLQWVILWLYADISQSAWIAMFLQLIPAAIVWAVWSGTPLRAHSKLMTRLRLALLPCVMLDACVTLSSLALFCQLQLPYWPSYGVALALMGFAFVITLASGKHGVAFGINQIRAFLLILFLGSLLLDVKPDVNHLWPLWGNSPQELLLAALRAAGGVWSIALLYTLPGDALPIKQPEKRSFSLPWALLPVLLVALWALWICLCGVWQPENHLLPKEKMIVLTWMGSNLVSFQLSTVFWLLLLAVSLVSNAAIATNLLAEAFPRVVKPPLVAVYLLPPLVFGFFSAEPALKFLKLFLPYRSVLSLAVGLVILIAGRKRAR